MLHTATYTLTFVGFSTTSELIRNYVNTLNLNLNQYIEPSGFAGEATSFNFTASQTGLFNDPTTWSGRIVPYGNATVVIPSGITVTIAGSSLDVFVLTFDIYGTLAVGQGASNFKFSYPTAVIIRSGGTLKDLTTSKSVTFTSDTLITALDGSTNFGNDTSVVIGSSSTKRAIGDVLRFSGIPFTCGIINSGGLTFPRINPICRRNGSILSAYTYLGGFAPTVSLCGISGCGIYIPTGISISTSEVSGIMSIRISYLDVATGANLSIGSSGVLGFKFSYAIQIEVYGVLSFVGSGGSLQIPVGSAFNIYSGASFRPTTAASVSIVSIDTPDNSPGPGVILDGGTSGPFYINILSSGEIDINHESKKKFQIL